MSKKQEMVKNIHKFQVGTEVNQNSPTYHKFEKSGEGKKTKPEQGLIPLLVLMVLVGISLSLINNSFLLDKLLICSAIILSILFFRSAELNGDLNDDF